MFLSIIRTVVRKLSNGCSVLNYIQNKGKNRTTGLNYFLKAFTDYYEFNKEADNLLKEQSQIPDKQNANNLKGNEIRYA